MVAYTKPQKRKKEGKGKEEREMRSSLLILDLKDAMLYDAGNEEEGKMFHQLNVLGMTDGFWDALPLSLPYSFWDLKRRPW